MEVSYQSPSFLHLLPLSICMYASSCVKNGFFLFPSLVFNKFVAKRIRSLVVICGFLWVSLFLLPLSWFHDDVRKTAALGFDIVSSNVGLCSTLDLFFVSPDSSS